MKRTCGSSGRAVTLGMVAVAILLAGSPVLAGSRIGDGGHFLMSGAGVYANNPTGKAFTVTVHRHIWASHPLYNDGAYEITVVDPGHKAVATGTIPSGKSKAVLKVPKGAGGVYRIRYKGAGYSLTWIECSLDQMVAAAGDWDMKAGYGGTFALHAMTPRRWYFYVPAGVKEFKVKTTANPGATSPREDWGYFVMNPRGQRVNAVYGGVPPRSRQRDALVKNGFIVDERKIYVDEGTAGRFWSLWVTGGDSHSFSDLQILIKGAAPFYAPSPEQWFDPRTGKAPAKLIYDTSQIRALDYMSKKDAKGRRLSRDHYNWAPSPLLGDEDYTGMRGPHSVFLRNPEGRAIDFGTCAYVISPKSRVPVHYRVFAPGGKGILDKTGSFAWRDSSRISIPASGKGVYRVDVDCKEWYAWAEPAPPMVLAGKPIKGGGARFSLQIGIARHWFFKVPKGTKEFGVTVNVPDRNHALLTEIHAPDRMVDVLYARGPRPREVKVTVPTGLDDKIWFLRTEVGSMTRYLSTDATKLKRVRIDADIDLTGVPGFLAPTWEQWFLPRPQGG